MPSTRKYDGMWLISLDAEGNARTCNYWYLVQTFGCTAHTAFHSKAALMLWLTDRGLTVDNPIPDPGTHSVQRINGAYRDAMHMMAREEFDAMEGAPAIKLDNAQYTTAKLTKDADGLVTVHFLNCNVPDREVHDYRVMRERIG